MFEINTEGIICILSMPCTVKLVSYYTGSSLSPATPRMCHCMKYLHTPTIKLNTLGPATPKVFPDKVWCDLVTCVMNYKLLLKNTEMNPCPLIILNSSCIIMNWITINFSATMHSSLLIDWTHKYGRILVSKQMSL